MNHELARRLPFGKQMLLCPALLIGLAASAFGTTSFTNATIVITATADTSNIQPFVNGLYVNNDVAFIAISGIGSFRFVTTTAFFVSYDYQLSGFSRSGVGNGDLLDGPANSAFSSWNMLTSIGPFTGSGQTGHAWWMFPPVILEEGRHLELHFASPVTFSAEVSGDLIQFKDSATADGTVITPEPGSITLAATGFMGIVGYLRKKWKNKNSEVGQACIL